MSSIPHRYQPDPALDLSFERIVDVSPDLVWLAWTDPEHLKKWFTPAPWRTIECEIDLRPGGIFRTVMQGPDGPPMPGVGCYLEVVPQRKLVWTNALLPGFRPAPPVEAGGFAFTGVITLEPFGTGTRYTALVLHSDAAGAKMHEDMGFYHGWGAALDQLVALMRPHSDATPNS